MNTIHQISLKLRLGIDTHANIQPEILLKKWQELNDSRLCSISQARSPGPSQAGKNTASGHNVARRK